MNFEAALTQELKSIAAFSNRVYPLTAPEANAGQGVPYLIYGSSPGVRTKTMSGYGEGKTVRGELNIITSRYSDLKTLEDSVLELLIGMERRVIGTGGPHIQEFLYNDPVEMYESQPNLYRCVIDFEVYL